MSQSTQTPYLFFVQWWKLNKFGADALQVAASHLLQNPKIGPQESLDFWAGVSSTIPPADQPEVLGLFIDGFGHGAKARFAKLAELLKQAAAKKRAQP